MDDYSLFKKKIQHRWEILEEAIQELEKAGAAETRTVQCWRNHLSDIGQSMEDPFLRIAVAGSVKSGKSTLINAMLGEDLLKRGAGIITAFLTRIISADDPGGWVELKSWQQINDEVNASLHMLPLFDDRESARPLDIRDPEDRTRLGFWLDRMRSEWLQSRGGIDPHFLFLERCLQGFDLIREEIGDEIRRTAFDKVNLSRHQLYVGEESRSVWVRDIELYHPVSWLGERIELADCQGSDSPNPTHYELLQKYLLQAHFIIYVISSRTGLREADFKLLNLIKALRMFPQTLFVLNLDLDAHADRDELDKCIERVRSELSWMVPDPRLFAFSGLFHLLRQLGEKSPKPDRRRMKLWKESKALTKAAEGGFSAFKKELDLRINARKSQVLLGFGFSRLEMVAANMLDSVCLRHSVLEQNAGAVRQTAEQLQSRHSALQSTLESLADAVSGLNQNLKGELGAKIDSFFDPAAGPVVREAIDIVERSAYTRLREYEDADYARLIREYYSFYLDFRRELIGRLTDRVNLGIMELVKDEEALLRQRIKESSRTMWGFFDAALADYRRDILGPEIQASGTWTASAGVEPDFSGIALPPPFSAFLDRGGIVRGILFIKFGITSLSGVLHGIRAKMRKSLLRGSDNGSMEELFEHARQKARSEAKSELLRAIGDFRENLKGTYLYRIIDEGCIFLLREFKARAEMVQADFVNLLRQSQLRGEERLAALEVLASSRQIASAMIDDLAELRREVLEGLPTRTEQESPRERELPA
ncbi:MAG: dynamin family protein [Syntrophobacter sp.]